MWETASQYLLFLLETATIVLAIIITFATVAGIALKNKLKPKGELSIKPMHDDYDALKHKMESAVCSKSVLKEKQKAEKKRKKEKSKIEETDKKNVFVLDFKGDIRASSVEALREEVTAVLQVAESKDEVLLRLDSPGGLVHGYGLAASQLRRIKAKSIPLTVSVDKVAASGGYMMACVADKIISAPFAILGSIGVLAQIPNFNRLLKDHKVDFEQLTAGEYKRTLTMFGKNTDAGRAKMQEEIDETHNLFKAFVHENRPKVVIDDVATGEHWFGEQAMTKQLVDEIQTSDDYLLSCYEKQHCNLYKVTYKTKKNLAEKIGSSAKQVMIELASFFGKKETLN